MSLLIYAGASQFIGVNLLVLGASFREIQFGISDCRMYRVNTAGLVEIESYIRGSWRHSRSSYCKYIF
jgi:hypothetical protein